MNAINTLGGKCKSLRAYQTKNQTLFSLGKMAIVPHAEMNVGHHRTFVPCLRRTAPARQATDVSPIGRCLNTRRSRSGHRKRVRAGSGKQKGTAAFFSFDAHLVLAHRLRIAYLLINETQHKETRQ